MNAEQVESTLVQMIEGIGIAALPYPEKPDGYFPDADPGEVLVRYEGEKSLKRDLSGTILKREMYFEIVFVSRQVRGKDGIYNWMECVENLFEGCTLPGAGGYLILENEGFVSENNGIWQFSQKWKLTENTEYEQQDDYADCCLRA